MTLDISRYTAFIFDFDGVIVDSLRVKTEAFGELFGGYGNDIRKQVMDYHRANGGVSRYKKFEYYYAKILKTRITPSIMRRLDRQYSELVEHRVIRSPFIKGAKELIAALKSARKRLFIISGTPQREIRRIVKAKGIQRFFCKVYGSPASKKEIVRTVLKEYSIPARGALYIGDAKSDWQAARMFNIDFVSVVNTQSTELTSINCLCKIRDLSGLSASTKKKTKDT
jgi:HAD superfamily hydrolase (TIGR01549 family)